jgi:DNA-binding protein H-NS
MTTYADVKKQIAQLEKKAADLRKVEVAKAVANIREQMVKYELTVDDIAPGKSSGKVKTAARSAKVKVAKPAKYMDPNTGKTWTGHGKAPAWIAGATKNGRRDDFLIDKVKQAKDAKSAATNAPATASMSTGIRKKVAPKMPRAVAKKVPVAKKTAPAKKAKAVAPAKKSTKKTPAKVAAKPKTNAKVTVKSAGVTKAPKKVSMLSQSVAATKGATS